MVSAFFEDNDYYTGPVLTKEMVHRAEDFLGFNLPSSYLSLLSERNGGVPIRRCYHTSYETSWAKDYFEIRTILGIGHEKGIDSLSGLGSRDLIMEWDYPDIGIVICDTPSGGHDTVMLDYRNVGREGEPAVVYVDEDRVPKRAAESFGEFVSKLKECDD